MKRVYTGYGVVAHLLCDLLNAEGIPSATSDSGGMDSADISSVWVLDESDFGRAAKFVEEFSQRSSEHESSPTWQCGACGEYVEEQFVSCWKCSAPDVAREDVRNEEELQEHASNPNRPNRTNRPNRWMGSSS